MTRQTTPGEETTTLSTRYLQGRTNGFGRGGGAEHCKRPAVPVYRRQSRTVCRCPTPPDPSAQHCATFFSGRISDGQDAGYQTIADAGTLFMHLHNMLKPLHVARCQQAGDVTGLTRIPSRQNINPGQSFVHPLRTDAAQMERAQCIKIGLQWHTALSTVQKQR